MLSAGPSTIAGRSRSLRPANLERETLYPTKSWVGVRSAFERQLDDRFAAFSFGAIVQRNASPMRLGDLPAQG